MIASGFAGRWLADFRCTLMEYQELQKRVDALERKS